MSEHLVPTEQIMPFQNCVPFNRGDPEPVIGPHFIVWEWPPLKAKGEWPHPVSIGVPEKYSSGRPAHVAVGKLKEMLTCIRQIGDL